MFYRITGISIVGLLVTITLSTTGCSRGGQQASAGSTEFGNTSGLVPGSTGQLTPQASLPPNIFSSNVNNDPLPGTTIPTSSPVPTPSPSTQNTATAIPTNTNCLTSNTGLLGMPSTGMGWGPSAAGTNCWSALQPLTEENLWQAGISSTNYLAAAYYEALARDPGSYATQAQIEAAADQAYMALIRAARTAMQQRAGMTTWQVPQQQYYGTMDHIYYGMLNSLSPHPNQNYPTGWIR